MLSYMFAKLFALPSASSTFSTTTLPAISTATMSTFSATAMPAMVLAYLPTTTTKAIATAKTFTTT
jgi:hypothetical protein